MTANQWTRAKPTVAGKYMTRLDENDMCYVAIVSMMGECLCVEFPQYGERIRMSKLGEEEMEWMKVPDGSAGWNYWMQQSRS